MQDSPELRYKELKLFEEHPECFHFNRKIIISSVESWFLKDMT